MADIRLIDANTMRNDWLENGENEYVYDTNAVLDSIDAQPTIDPESLRPVGRWIKKKPGDKKIYCSRCGRQNGTHTKRPFCSGCGARMKGETK